MFHFFYSVILWKVVHNLSHKTHFKKKKKRSIFKYNSNSCNYFPCFPSEVKSVDSPPVGVQSSSSKAQKVTRLRKRQLYTLRFNVYSFTSV